MTSQGTTNRDARLRSVCVLTCSLLGLAGGCGGEDRGLVAVFGRVTLDGDSMPAAGDLTFVPIEVEQGFPMRPAKAEFGPDGEYQAQSFQPGDGLYPGQYRVTVYCWEVPPTPNGPPARSYISPRFQSQMESGLVVDVKSGSDAIEFNIDVTSPQ